MVPRTVNTCVPRTINGTGHWYHGWDQTQPKDARLVGLHEQLFLEIVQPLNARVAASAFLRAFPVSRVAIEPPTAEERRTALAFTGPPALTAVCMTYGDEAKARKALDVLKALAAVTTEATVPDLVLLFNPLGEGAYVPPPSFVEELGPRGRLVVAHRNDLLNRFNMTLVKPRTDGILLLDDDDAVLGKENYVALLAAFAATGGHRVLAGGDHTRRPVLMSRRVSGRMTDDNGVHREERASCPGHVGPEYQQGGAACNFMAEPANLVYHRALGAAFLDPAHARLHDFVLRQAAKPDDFAFAAFAAWYLKAPVIAPLPRGEIHTSYHKGKHFDSDGPPPRKRRHGSGPGPKGRHGTPRGGSGPAGRHGPPRAAAGPVGPRARRRRRRRPCRGPPPPRHGRGARLVPLPGLGRLLARPVLRGAPGLPGPGLHTLSRRLRRLEPDAPVGRVGRVLAGRAGPCCPPRSQSLRVRLTPKRFFH